MAVTLSPQTKELLHPHEGGGSALYTPDFLAAADAGHYFTRLQAESTWEQEGSGCYMQPRLTAYVGNRPHTYSRVVTHAAAAWTPGVAALAELVARTTGQVPNAALLNRYLDGRGSIQLHQDDENIIVPRSVIACVSLGAPRAFTMRHRLTGERVVVTLEPGSLLVMDSDIQAPNGWEHDIAKCKKPEDAGERISVTFRHHLD